jgi:tetratricopeptide (TPR) repeat protein
MTHAWSLSRRCVLIVLLSAFFLAAQERTNWDTHFQEGAQAFEAGRYAQAIDSLTAALQDAVAFPTSDLRRADAAHLLGMSYQFRGDFDRAEIFYLQAKTIRESNGEAGRKVLGITLDGMAQLRFEQERWKDAEELARQALSICNQTRGEYDQCALTAKRHLGEIYSVEGRLAEGENILQQVIRAARRDPALGPQLLPVVLRDQALIFIAKGQHSQAEPLLKEALDLSTKLGADRPETADNLVALARLYRTEGDAGRAEPLLNQAAAIYQKNDDSCLAHALQELGMIAITDGKYAIARQHLLRAIGTYRTFLGADHINVAFAQVGLAEAYLGERNYAEAQSAIEPALAKETAVLTDAHPELARAHMIAARISEGLRRSPDAAAHYRQALDIYRRITPRDNPVRVMAERQYERFSKSFRK